MRMEIARVAPADGMLVFHCEEWQLPPFVGFPVYCYGPGDARYLGHVESVDREALTWVMRVTETRRAGRFSPCRNELTKISLR